MLLTITTTYKPATDIGFLLHKNPYRCQSTKLPFGTVNVFYPEASEAKCTAAILLDINSVALVRGRKASNTSMPLEQYVNDRPYVCSSFMSVALSRVFSQTLNGKCKNKPELVKTKMPLECKISVFHNRIFNGNHNRSPSDNRRKDYYAINELALTILFIDCHDDRVYVLLSRIERATASSRGSYSGVAIK